MNEQELKAAADYPDLLMFVRMVESADDPAKPMELWAVVTEADANAGTAVVDGPTAKVRYYTGLRKKLYSCAPGAVFRVRLTDTQVEFRPKSWPLLTYGDEDKVAEWRATTIGVERVARAHAALKSRVLQQHDRERLEPLRTAYRRASGQVRVQMLAEFVRYITSHSVND